MSVTLSPFQRQIVDFIGQSSSAARAEFRQSGGSEKACRLISTAAIYAYALHHDLSGLGVTLPYSQQLLDTRGVPTSDMEFFNHLHVLDELIGLIG